MERITQKQLERLVDRINEATRSPMAPWTRDGDKLTANIGNYHLSGAYGGVALERMCNEGGDVSTVFFCGRIPKRDLYNRMSAFLAGVDAARR